MKCGDFLHSACTAALFRLLGLSPIHALQIQMVETEYGHFFREYKAASRFAASQLSIHYSFFSQNFAGEKYALLLVNVVLIKYSFNWGQHNKVVGLLTVRV